jgi:hypothetical protein
MRLTMQVKPVPGVSRFGLSLRAGDDNGDGCKLWLEPAKQRVEFHADDKDPGKTKETNCAIEHVENLDHPFSLEVIVKDDIIDICIDNRRTIIARYKGAGTNLLFLAHRGEVVLDNITICSFLSTGHL